MLSVLFAIVVLAGPLLRPLQLWDHWLAWGMYSPSNSRVEVLVSDMGRERCDKNLQQYFQESDEQFGSSEFAIGRWSLDELGVPIYPQARFQKAAAIEWLRQLKLQDQATLIEFGPSHPVSGAREKTMVAIEP